jgi:5-methylcytosine-specific restriction endonuclease McrA
MEIIGRDEASKRGLTYYFTGKPCTNGHIAPRYVNDGACAECAKEKLRRKRQAHREASGKPPRISLEEARERARAAGEATFWIDRLCIRGHKAARRTDNGGCVECGTLSRKKFYEGNKEYFARQSTTWRRENPEGSRRIKRESDVRAKAKDPEGFQARKRAAALDSYYRRKDERKGDPEYLAKRGAIRRNWERKNSDKNIACKRTWRRNNPEMCAAHAANRRARERGAPGRITAADLKFLLEHQSYRCAAPWCQADILLHDYHHDHIKALARGGDNSLENSQLLCIPCNLSKGDRTMEEWEAARERNAQADAELAIRLRLKRRSKR